MGNGDVSSSINGVSTRTLDIAIVDDNQGDIKLLSENIDAYMADISHSVQGFCVGDNFDRQMEELIRRKPDVAIVDFYLGPHNGAELVLRLHKESPKTAIFGISGREDVMAKQDFDREAPGSCTHVFSKDLDRKIAIGIMKTKLMKPLYVAIIGAGGDYGYAVAADLAKHPEFSRIGLYSGRAGTKEVLQLLDQIQGSRFCKYEQYSKLEDLCASGPNIIIVSTSKERRVVELKTAHHRNRRELFPLNAMHHAQVAAELVKMYGRKKFPLIQPYANPPPYLIALYERIGIPAGCLVSFLEPDGKRIVEKLGTEPNLRETLTDDEWMRVKRSIGGDHGNPKMVRSTWVVKHFGPDYKAICRRAEEYAAGNPRKLMKLLDGQPNDVAPESIVVPLARMAHYQQVGVNGHIIYESGGFKGAPSLPFETNYRGEQIEVKPSESAIEEDGRDAWFVKKEGPRTNVHIRDQALRVEKEMPMIRKKLESLGYKLPS